MLNVELNTKRKILLADDNVLNRKLAWNLLQGLGLDTDTSESGPDTFEKLKATNYDLVLARIELIAANDYELIHKVRTELKLNLPIIAVSMDLQEFDRERCLNLGIRDSIAVPYRKKELAGVLGKYLNHPPSAHGVLDLNELYSLSRGNKPFIVEIIKLFLEKNPPELAELAAAISGKDFKTIQTISHRMKSSVGYTGLQALVEPLNEMELLAERRAGLKRIQELFSGIKQACEKGALELKNEWLKLENEKI